MSVIDWILLVGVVWVLVSVAFMAGSAWGSTATASRFIEDQDHGRFERDERVRDAAEMALDGIDWP
jgi:hypothetical protein